MKVAGIAGVAAPPVGLGLTGPVPWWAYLIAISLGPVVYICRSIMVMRLGSKALDKVSPERVPDVMNAVTGYQKSSLIRRRIGKGP